MTTTARTYRIEQRHSKYGYEATAVTDDGNGNPLDHAEAERIARILRTVNGPDSGMTVSVHANPVPVGDALRLLGGILDAVAANGVTDLPQWRIDGTTLTVTLPDNERALVDQWAVVLGLSGWAVGRGLGQFYAHYTAKGETEKVPGWTVEVTCGLQTTRPASVHGDDLTTPDPAEYAVWKAARDAAENVPAADEPVKSTKKVRIPAPVSA